MDTLVDFLRKYGDCYIKRNLDGKVFYLHSRNRGDGENRVNLESEDTGNFQVAYGEKFLEDYSFEFPEVGFFQHKKWALLVLKGYARQYQRGLSNNTTNILNPMNYLAKYIRVPGNPKLREEIADAIWNRKNFKLTLKRAREFLIQEKMNSIVLNNNFSLSLSHCHDGFILWNLVSPVAMLAAKESQISMVDNVFKQEVRDYLSRTGQDAEWKVHNG